MRRHTQTKGCRALTDDEVARVSQAFQGTYAARDRALFVLGVKTGFRISALLNLRVGDAWQYGQFMERVVVSRRYMKGKTEGRSVILRPRSSASSARISRPLLPQRSGKPTRAWNVQDVPPVRGANSWPRC